MTILYNCKPEGSSHRITKFDNDLNVESTYLCTKSTCECPAGHRHTCRHRQMLPRFLAKPGAERGQWLYDYGRQHWVRASTGEDATEESNDLEQTQMMIGEEPTIAHPITLPDDATGEDVANAFAGLMGQQYSAKDDVVRPINMLELAKLPQNAGIPIREVDEINPTTKPMRRI